MMPVGHPDAPGHRTDQDRGVVEPVAGEMTAVGGDRHREVWLRAAWSRLAEPGDSQAVALVARAGLAGSLRAVLDGVPGTERYQPRARRLDVDGDLARAARVGARVVIPSDPHWPPGLSQLAEPPFCLWVKGPGLSAVARSVAVVGARASTAYGERVAEELGAGLAQRGYTVVSGAAYGIDHAAHRGALAVEGDTVAVLACGVDRCYPSGHADLLAMIAERGAVVSEVPPGGAPTRNRFLTRNRLIATMSLGTVVVEAALRSGSLNTAGWASRHCRPVAAVPGPVSSVASAGCHQAIRDGMAVLVTDTADVVELVGRLGDDAAPVRRGPVDPSDLVDPDGRQVLGALPSRRPVPVEALARSSGRDERAVLRALGRLERAGLAERIDGGWRRRAPTGVADGAGDAGR